MSEIEHHQPLSMLPRWVMCGIDNPSSKYPCRLIASDKLTHGELSYRAKVSDVFIGISVSTIPVSHQLTLTTHMTDMIIIDGKTWQLCFEELFRNRKWTPDMPAIEA